MNGIATMAFDINLAINAPLHHFYYRCLWWATFSAALSVPARIISNTRGKTGSHLSFFRNRSASFTIRYNFESALDVHQTSSSPIPPLRQFTDLRR